MALNEATLPLILYRKVKPMVIVSQCENIMSHFYIPCFIPFSASAIPTPFFIFHFFFLYITIIILL